MVIRNNAALLQKGANDPGSEEWYSKALSFPNGLESPSTPLSPRLSRQRSIRRNYSITATVTVAGPSYSTLPTPKLTRFAPHSTSTMAQKQTETARAVNSDPATQDFQGDIKVSASLPSKSMLEKTADLPVFDVDGKTVPFKSLYWSEVGENKRVMIIFIRHFFCGVCIIALLIYYDQ
jgi:hypothetical protein